MYDVIKCKWMKNKRWKNNIPLLFYAVFRNEKTMI